MVIRRRYCSVAKEPRRPALAEKREFPSLDGYAAAKAFKGANMKNWIDRHFSDNVHAQTTIAIVGSVVGAVGVVLFILGLVLWR